MSYLLIVEDETVILDNLRQLLTLTGFEVKDCSDGEMARQWLMQQVQQQRRLPDLVLSDLMMPNLDGFGLLRFVRSQAELTELPFVLLSARSDTADLKMAFALGASDYMVKPFELDDLLRRLGKLLGGKPVVADLAAPSSRAHDAARYEGMHDSLPLFKGA